MNYSIKRNLHTDFSVFEENNFADTKLLLKMKFSYRELSELCSRSSLFFAKLNKLGLFR